MRRDRRPSGKSTALSGNRGSDCRVSTSGPAVPALALFGLVRLLISGAVGLTIVYAILSWVNADSPMFDVIDRLVAPLLRPFRRVIPLVGGFDLSPLALLVILQVLAINVAN